jgi:hypothetical protein
MDLRERLQEAVKGLARHVVEEEYQGIIVSGRSAPVPIRFLELGTLLEFGRPLMVPVHAFDDIGNQILYKSYCIDSPNPLDVVASPLHIERLSAYMAKEQQELMTQQGEKLFFIDDYAFSGTKMNKLYQVWSAMDFDVSFGVLAARLSIYAHEFSSELVVASFDSDIFALVSDLANYVKTHGTNNYAELSAGMKNEALEKHTLQRRILARFQPSEQ